MMRVRVESVVGVVSLSLALIAVAPNSTAKGKPPAGLLAASAAEVVVLVNPETGNLSSINTGPVAWLFPAPGGVLFAPDLAHGRTTVVDLRTQAARDRFDGITMPHFGTLADRYLVLTKRLLVMSYPDRALVKSLGIGFEHPWQVEVAANNTVLFVLERMPVGKGDVTMTAVNLTEGRLVYRKALAGDVRNFALSTRLVLVALADAETSRVTLADPATLSPRAVFDTNVTPKDVVFAGDGSILVVAVERADGGGGLLIWQIKEKKGEGLHRKKQWMVSLDAAPVHLAVSPDGRHVAVALTTGELHIVEIEKQEMLTTVSLPEAPRDLVWCDPSLDGPLLPDWSDDDEPTLDLGGP